MPNIYLTINIFNKENNIEPWRYIGSDQRDNPAYLGSSKSLKKDIVNLGSSKFLKTILESFDSINNKELRRKEAEYLKLHNVKLDNSYYNLTDIYAPAGGKLGMKMPPRTESHRINWSNSRKGHVISQATKDIWKIQRTGRVVSVDTKIKMSESNSKHYLGKSGIEHPLTGFKHSDEERIARSIRAKKQMSTLENKKAQSDRAARQFLVNSPAGDTYLITNLSKWCKERNLLCSMVRSNNKGWTCKRQD